MKSSFLCVAAIAVAALSAGCAEMHRSSSMGAGPASTNAQSGTVCQDGTVLAPNSKCRLHGGVAHQTEAAPAPAQK